MSRKRKGYSCAHLMTINELPPTVLQLQVAGVLILIFILFFLLPGVVVKA
jgi:hypothetical protein